MEGKPHKSKDPLPRGGTSKDPMEYYPEHPPPHGQPGTREPGDEVTPPGEIVIEQELAEANLETGRPAAPMPPDDVLLPNAEEASPERPANPAWPKERQQRRKK